jgi:ferritin-like metal-binding protein YciE
MQIGQELFMHGLNNMVDAEAQLGQALNGLAADSRARS